MKRFLILLAVVAAAGCSSSDPDAPRTPAMPAMPKSTGYSAESTNEPVGVIPAAVLHDAARNKDLEVAIEYPAKGGPFPLIIFSHDYGSSDRAYEQLVDFWTSHGYVVARPAHADAGAPQDAMKAIFAEHPNERRERKPKKEVADQMRKERETAAMKQVADVWTKEREPQWRDRARDISFIIDSLDTIEQRFPELKGKIAHDKIGVAGHELGAFTAMLVGGMKADSLSIGDPRVKAVIAMSPQGVSENRGLTPSSWAGVNIPMMFMAGSLDRGANENETWEWQKTAFSDAPAGDKYFVLLEGVHQSAFLGTYSPVDIYPTSSIPVQTTNPRDPYAPPQAMQPAQQRTGPINPQTGRQSFADIRVTSLAFWDAYLKSDAKGKDFLATKTDLLSGVKVEKK